MLTKNKDLMEKYTYKLHLRGVDMLKNKLFQAISNKKDKYFIFITYLRTSFERNKFLLM